MISADSQTLLLLCSHLGLPSEPEFLPLTLREWNPIARKLQSAHLRPGILLDWGTSELQTQLAIPPKEALRLAQLLERSSTLAIALERFSNLGIHTLTRADKEYPENIVHD